jgi:hypothetical protein
MRRHLWAITPFVGAVIAGFLVLTPIRADGPNFATDADDVRSYDCGSALSVLSPLAGSPLWEQVAPEVGPCVRAAYNRLLLGIVVLEVSAVLGFVVARRRSSGISSAA